MSNSDTDEDEIVAEIAAENNDVAAEVESSGSDELENEVAEQEVEENHGEEMMVLDDQEESDEGNRFMLNLGEENEPMIVQFRNYLARHLSGHRFAPHSQGARQFRQWRRWLVRRRDRVNGDAADSESDDDDDDTNSEMPKNITFDQNLPTSHLYLGEMEECSGVTYQEEDTYQTLSLLYVTDFVLVPGQTLPLQISRLTEVSMIRQVMQEPGKTFGISTMINSVDSDTRQSRSGIGCTAEIRSFQDKEEYQVTTLRIVVIGRQKFNVMEYRRQLNGNLIAKVRIESDVELEDMSNCVGMSRPQLRCGNSSARDESGGRRMLHSMTPLAKNYLKSWSTIQHTAWSTSWSPWVYRMYDVHFLRMEIFRELREWNLNLKEKQCPQGATDFSYWVITNIPITDKWKLHLLRLNSAIQRMRCELHILQKCSVLTCSDCTQRIADRKDVFSMSVSGPMAAYVNPGGVVHETLTLYKTSGLEHIGRKSTEHSWFPGYAWTICECRNCGRHMGWKFTATRSDLIPQKFWGLTRSALVPVVQTTNRDETLEDDMLEREFDLNSMPVT